MRQLLCSCSRAMHGFGRGGLLPTGARPQIQGQASAQRCRIEGLSDWFLISRVSKKLFDVL